MSTLTMPNALPLKPLTGLLVLQLLLSLWLIWPEQEASEVRAPLLPSPMTELTNLVISSGNEEVAMVKKGEQWQLSSYFDLPVREQKIEELLSRLDALKTGWPVSKSEQGAKRFEVSEHQFQKRVHLTWQNGQEETLYLGRSPGYRKQYVRLASSDHVSIQDLSAYQFSTTGKSWLDSSLLAQTNPVKVATTGLSLVKEEAGWAFEGPQRQLLDDKAWQDWLRKLSQLTIMEAEAQKVDELKLSQPKVELSLWTERQGQATRYSLYVEDDQHWLIHSGYNLAFKLSESQAELFKQFTVEQFIKQSESKTQEEPISEAKATQEPLSNVP